MARGSLGAVANSLIGEAKLAKKREERLTKEQRLLLVMKDGRWHKGSELAYRVSWRFGGYLHSLKQKGRRMGEAPRPEMPEGRELVRLPARLREGR